MSQLLPKKGSHFWIGASFFLLGTAPGFWIPVLANIIANQGWEAHITTSFFLISLTGMISPLFIGARADQVIAGEKLLAIIVGGGTVFLWLTFRTLDKGQNLYLFLIFLTISSLITAPAWSLLNTVALTNLEDPEKDFGKYRVWGTIGWMSAGLITSLLMLDKSAQVGNLAVVARLLGAACCLMLPHTPPKGGRPKNWQETLGLGALSALKNRDLLLFFVTSFLFFIPISAFYLHTPRLLDHLGWKSVAAGLTLGQATEVVAMLLLGYFLKRWRIKWLLLLALFSGLVRYALYAVGDIQHSPYWVLAGVALHGICWTYFFEAGRVFIQKRVDPSIRAQSQALLSLFTGGLGGTVGVAIVGWLCSSQVDQETGDGWASYWAILSGMCFICLLIFLFGYRGANEPSD